MKLHYITILFFCIISMSLQAQIHDTLPVIVHVIHNGEAVGTGRNLSQAQVNSQFDVLNEDYRMQNVDLVNTPGVFMPYVADMGLNFSKALTGPNGSTLSEPGIERIDRSAMGWSSGPYTMSYIESTIKPQTIWDPMHYLNIWVLDLSNGMLGYSSFPANSTLSCMPAVSPDSLRDGIVVLSTAFGRTGNVLAPFDKGRTATFEIGRWLGLKQLSSTNCGDDCVADTPLGDYNPGCPTFPQVSSTCNNSPNGDMFMNFMSYVDDPCKVMFTHGQKSRIDTCLTHGTFQSALRMAGTSGIKNYSQAAIDVYPNPSKGSISLRLQAGTYKLELFSAIGEKVLGMEVNCPSVIDIPANAPSGIYLLKATGEKNIYSSRIILQR
jgi:hypothetical protein